MSAFLAALWNALNPIVIDLIVALLGALGTVAAAYLTSLIRNKVKNENLRALLDRVDDFAFDAVRAVWQASVEAAKADGKLTKEDAKAAKDAAIAALKAYLGEKGLAELKATFGTDDNVEKVLDAKIEKAVYDAKRAGSNRIGQTTAAL